MANGCFLCAAVLGVRWTHGRFHDLVGVLLAVGMLGGTGLPRNIAGGETQRYSGPCAIAVSEDGKTAYVANADARQVAWIELPAGPVTRRIQTLSEPSGLVLSPDGTRLMVTCAAPRSTVLVLDAATGQTLASIAAGHTAMGPTVTPDGKRLYVCNGDGDRHPEPLDGGDSLAPRFAQLAGDMRFSRRQTRLCDAPGVQL